MPPQKRKKGKAVKNKKSVVRRKKAVQRNHNSYSIEQKREVITYAKENGRNEAARYFNLNGSMVGH